MQILECAPLTLEPNTISFMLMFLDVFAQLRYSCSSSAFTVNRNKQEMNIMKTCVFTNNGL